MIAPENPQDDAGIPLLPGIGVILVVGICCVFGLLLVKAPSRKSGTRAVSPRAPEFSQRLQDSIQYFRRQGPSQAITLIHFNDDAATDQEMEEISKIRSVTSVSFCSHNVTDRGLRSLTRLPDLGSISCTDRSGISDEAFKVLGEFKKLTWINVKGTLFGDEGLASLNGLPHLSSLRLEKTLITDLGLRKVESLPELRELYLDETQVGQIGPILEDFGFARLPGFPNLQILSLAGTRVRDDCLAELPKCQALQSINLSGVALTPEGCRSLAQCPALKSLILSSESITGAHLAELAKSPMLQDLRIDKSSIEAHDLIQLNQLHRLKTCIVRSSRASREDTHATILKHLPGVTVEFVCGAPDKKTEAASAWTWITGN